MPEKNRQTSGAWLIVEYSVRSLIMKVHTLRKTIEDEEALRRNHPEEWRRRDRQRKARNREQAQLNRELLAAGCRPGEPA